MTTAQYAGMFIVFRLRDAVTDQLVAEFALPATPAGWSTNLTLPATADTTKVREYRVEIVACATNPPPATAEPRPQRGRGHAVPHFNEGGGCLCRCYRCVQVRMKEHDGFVAVNQYCICRDCTQDCPSDGRVVFGRLPK